MLVQFDSDIEVRTGSAESLRERASWRKQTQLEETKQQIENCVMYAPAAGVVVHANRYSSRGGNAEFVVEAGATVRERQTSDSAARPTLMQVKCKINESRITLIREGMAVKLAVDAIPGLTLKGRVKKGQSLRRAGQLLQLFDQRVCGLC